MLKCSAASARSAVTLRRSNSAVAMTASTAVTIRQMKAPSRSPVIAVHTIVVSSPAPVTMARARVTST